MAEQQTTQDEASDRIIHLDMSRWPVIYERLIRIAEDEERTPEGQLRWWLRKIFNGESDSIDVDPIEPDAVSNTTKAEVTDGDA